MASSGSKAGECAASMGDGPSEREGGKHVAPRSVEGVSVPPGAPTACTEAPSPRDRIGGRLPTSRPNQGPGSSSPRRRRPGCPDLVGHSANFKMALN